MLLIIVYLPESVGNLTLTLTVAILIRLLQLVSGCTVLLHLCVADTNEVRSG